MELRPFCKFPTKRPNELRGCFAECRAAARITHCEGVDEDPGHTATKATFGLEGTGVAFAPGDRLAMTPKNSVKDATKMLVLQELEERYSEEVSLDRSLE
ncbi:MAG: hypothetical protein M1839_005782 [Geoglossum umbratile]|nr:MAG: hypothetical protein M1839_005782 [Geoglossum umbratile]